MDSHEPHFLINSLNYTKLHNACQYSEKMGKADDLNPRKAIPIAGTLHRLIAAEVTLELPLSKKLIMWQSLG